jgi:hypothetical protein
MKQSEALEMIFDLANSALSECPTPDEVKAFDIVEALIDDSKLLEDPELAQPPFDPENPFAFAGGVS